MLRLTNVTKRFGEKLILDRFTHVFMGGRVACLMGPSGCGKTTLLRVASGLLLPDGGKAEAPGDARASFLFQEDRLLPWLSARKNVTAVGVSPVKAEMYLQRVGLQAELDTLPALLSGGMRRRLAIARALAFGGDVFFLDEPLQGLDASTAQPVLEVLRETIGGRTALVVTHSPLEALALGDTILMLDGPPVRIVKSAAAADFADEEALAKWLS